MNNGNGFLLLGIAVLIIAIGAFIAFGMNGGEPKEGEGKVYFSITDAAADMEAVSEVTIEVDSIEVYSETNGWTNVSTNGDSFALLSLRDTNELQLAGEGNVAADTYTKVRVKFDDAKVEETSGETKSAAMTSGSFEFDTSLVVEEKANSHVTLDVLADKSLHTSTDGSYVFAPVVMVEARSNTEVSVGSNERVTLSGGSVTAQGTFGTDLDGSVKVNFELPADAQIDVGLFGGVSSSGNEEGNANASVETNTNASVNGGNTNIDTNVTGNVNTNL